MKKIPLQVPNESREMKDRVQRRINISLWIESGEFLEGLQWYWLIDYSHGRKILSVCAPLFKWKRLLTQLKMYIGSFILLKGELCLTHLENCTSTWKWAATFKEASLQLHIMKVWIEIVLLNSDFKKNVVSNHWVHCVPEILQKILISLSYPNWPQNGRSHKQARQCFKDAEKHH